MKNVLFVSILIAIGISCNSNVKYQIPKNVKRIPKVLIFTTGRDGKGTLPAGVTVAMETFNKMGAFVEIQNKDVLYDPELLND